MNPMAFAMRPRQARRLPLRPALAGLALATAALQLGGCASAPAPLAAAGAVQTEQPAVETTYGIRVEGLRLSAAGSMLDFRYRVLDASKAAPLLNGKVQPFLLDEARSARLGVPDTPVLGRIRQTARNNNIRTDHTYFVMFGNPGKAVQSGDKVTLLLGEVKITDLVVR
ncbi:MAG: hypothetical protein OEY03_13020 [Rhizobacter sp.]|nr:hypothetical protein [Rhizobacter sp.]